MEDCIIFNPHIGDIPTKDDLLSKISEEQIFTYYGCPIQKGLFCSPLRKDSHPTVSLYRSKRSGKLFYKDFGYPQHGGDVFWFVSTLFNCSFVEAINIIAKDFGLIKSEEPKNTPKIEYKGEKVTEHPGAVIKCEIKPFTTQELDWWGAYGITLETLKHFNVFSVRNVWLNGNLFHLCTGEQRVFGYYGGVDEDSIEKWKIYWPGVHKKFINNWPATMMQGLQQMPPKGDTLFIQKALKDVMVMYELGYTAIAPNSENAPLEDNVLEALKKRYKRIIIWMDNDDAGINSLNRIKERHPELEYYHLPSGGPKDFSDYVKKYGKESGKQLIKDNFFQESGGLPEDW